jgi:hypothetical protein
MLIIAAFLLIVFGFAFQPLFGVRDAPSVFVFLAIGCALAGLAYGPLGSAKHFGVAYAGYYLSAAGVVSLIAILLMKGASRTDELA